MSEDRWQLLQNLASSRGYELAVNGSTLTLSPRVELGRYNKSAVLTQALDAAGIESASKWLLSKRRLYDPWPFL
jgi:hypothetical protein